MTPIRQEVLEEVEDCIRRVAAFQEARGRRIHRSIKRSRKGRQGLEELAQFGVEIPEDLRALYHNYNGLKFLMMPIWEQTVFLQFLWPQMETVVVGNKIKRIEGPERIAGRLDVFRATDGLSLQIDPGAARAGEVPLLMTVGNLSRRNYLAFDSTLAMLRSVCAAQEAKILRYRTERCGVKEPGEVEYDPKELWDVIRPLNPRAEYWPALIAGTVDFDEITLPPPKTPGVIEMHPEVIRLIFGKKEDYYPQSEKEMRRAGMSEAEIIAARTAQKDEG